MNENDTPRPDGNWKNVIPPGFRPIQFPQVIDLDKEDSSDDEPMIVAQGDLRLTAEALGSMELLATILDKDRAGGSPLARQIADMARFWKGHVRLIGGMAAVVALALVGAVLPVGGTASAQAMEAPQPDPVASVTVGVRTVPVVLSSAYVSARIPVTTTHVTPAGYHCAAVYNARLGVVGRACSLFPTYTVPVRMDGRAVPLGRSTLTVVDDVAPFDGLPATVTLEARRPSKFGTGQWTPTYWGDGLTVTAPLFMYSPAAARWLPQQASPMQVQELVNGRWVVRATLWTNRRGVATGSVTLGGGLHTVRVARVTGATVTATVGTARTFYLVPTDVPVDIV